MQAVSPGRACRCDVTAAHVDSVHVAQQAAVILLWHVPHDHRLRAGVVAQHRHKQLIGLVAAGERARKGVGGAVARVVRQLEEIMPPELQVKAVPAQQRAASCDHRHEPGTAGGWCVVTKLHDIRR